MKFRGFLIKRRTTFVSHVKINHPKFDFNLLFMIKNQISIRLLSLKYEFLGFFGFFSNRLKFIRGNWKIGKPEKFVYMTKKSD